MAHQNMRTHQSALFCFAHHESHLRAAFLDRSDPLMASAATYWARLVALVFGARYTIGSHHIAPVAQRIEHPPPKRGAAGSIPAGRATF